MTDKEKRRQNTYSRIIQILELAHNDLKITTSVKMKTVHLEEKINPAEN